MKLIYIHGTPLDSESANMIQVLNMCEAFSQCGVSVLLAVPFSSNNTIDSVSTATQHLGHKPSIEILNFKKHTVFGRFKVLGNYFGAKFALKKSGFDICFVRCPLLLRLSINAGYPTVFESHNYLLHNGSRILARIWEYSLLKSASNKNLIKFIAISQALADYWSTKRVPEHKILAVHDGFNFRSFEKIQSREEARNIVDLPSHKKIVVYAGRLYEDREPERIIQIAEKYPFALFVVIGGPEERKNELVRLTRIKGVNNLLWKGHVPHSAVKDYLFAADVLLMMWSSRVPTIKYFSSLKMFEYMASGRIIVGQAYPTVKEVLENGVSAYLADPASLEDLIHKVGMALQERYPSDMASKARSLAFEEYSWDSRARKILSSLNGLMH